MKGLLQIHDPLRPAGHAVGIDLGTTNSLVATVVNGRAVSLAADEGGATMLPSVVHYARDGSVRVGRAARALAPEHPTDTLASVKRFMGKSLGDAQTKKLGAYRFSPGQGVVRFEVAGGRPVTPVEVSAEILRTLRRRAEAHFNAKVERAVITVPAYFDDAQRQATKDAGRLAGLDVLRLLNEPTAAALAYGLDKKSQGLFAVYDLGGGTFDVSVLKLTDGIFEVKATGGDSSLGGDDFDRAIADWVLSQRQLERPSAGEITELLAHARAAKEALSSESSTSVVFRGVATPLDRATFESLIRSWVERTGLVCRRALKDAGVTPGELAGVVLVGGSTRVPFVRQFVKDVFGVEPLADIDPDQVVALGAAIQADLLTNAERRDEVLLLDVIPLSLGLETMGGVVDKVIHRNTTIPFAAAQEFTTFQDGQNGMDIHVLQGERELVTDCRSLARFRLTGIPPLAAGMARVQVRFEVNADGLLSVSAKELSTGATQSIEVRPTHGLSDEDIEHMLLDSVEHAEDDMRARLLTEQRVEAQRVIEDARKQLRENGDLLDVNERTAFEEAMAALERLRTTAEDAQVLRDALAAADALARPFVERIMNRALRAAVAGKSIEDAQWPK